MDLRSFSDADKKQQQQNSEHPSRDDVYSAINHYSKFSNEQLMTELARQLAMQREKGKGDDITKTIEQIKPFLNTEQQQRMTEILKTAGGSNDRG